MGCIAGRRNSGGFDEVADAMWGAIILTSTITGVFCAVFATVVDVVTDALSMGLVIALAFASGFLGSMFAQVILKRDQ